jgi:hypothetical protein
MTTENSNNTTAATTEYKTKNQLYADLGPVLENPTCAEVYVRFKDNSTKIDRVAVIPELPSSHPVMVNMERWKFQRVARIYGSGIKHFIFKGFHNVSIKEQEKGAGTYVSTVFGDMPREDENYESFNLFMFKTQRIVNERDEQGQLVKDQNGKIATKIEGYVSSVVFEYADDKVSTDKLMAYKSCVLPLIIHAKELTKVQIVTNRGLWNIDADKIVRKTHETKPLPVSEYPNIPSGYTSTANMEPVASPFNEEPHANFVAKQENHEQFADAVYAEEVKQYETSNSGDMFKSATDELPF